MVVCGFVLGAGTALVSTELLGEAGDVDMAELMKAYQKYTTPGEGHKRLEFFEGVWEVDMKIWMEGPDAPPALSTATVSNTLMFGDRFLQTESRGTMTMEIGGTVMQIPTEAVGYIGYDIFKEKYVTIWIDSHNTGIYYAEGNVDETGKVFTYFGLMDMWEENARDRPYKIVDRVVDQNTMVTQMYDLMSTDARPIFEMTSKRKQPRKPTPPTPPTTQPDR